MNKSIGLIAVAAVAMLLVAATTMVQGASAHSHHGHSHGSSKNSQSLAQVNSCGNGFGSSHINCQNLGSQIQGSGNAVNVIGVQN